MTFDKKKLSKLKRAVRSYSKVLLQILTGDERPSPELLESLNLPSDITGLIDTFYKYGKLRAITDMGAEIDALTDEDFSSLVDNSTLTPVQKHAVEMSKIRAETFIESLEQRIISDATNEALQSDLRMWRTLAEETPTAISESMTREQFRSRIREKAQDWNRDWHRVAHTELWEAKCQGEAAAIIKNESIQSNDGVETEVYKQVSPDACPKCRELFYEADGITPKTFKLSELMENGTNVGRKQREWLPVVGCVHPNCHCVLCVKPKGTVFDETGKLVYKPRRFSE